MDDDEVEGGGVLSASKTVNKATSSSQRRQVRKEPLEEEDKEEDEAEDEDEEEKENERPRGAKVATQRKNGVNAKKKASVKPAPTRRGRPALAN